MNAHHAATTHRSFVVLALIGVLLALAVGGCGGSSTPADIPPPHADQLRMSVTRHPIGQVIFTLTSTNTRVIAGIQKEIADLFLVKPGMVFNCTPGSWAYDTYNMSFLDQDSVVESATTDARFCSFWTISTPRGTTTRGWGADSFWHTLHQLTGAPYPENYYTPTPSPEPSPTPSPPEY